MNQTNIIDITLDREFRCKRVRSTGRQLYWVTRSSICSLCSLIWLLHTAPCTYLSAHSLSHSRARVKVDDLMSHNDLSLSHSALGARKIAFQLINCRRTMVQKNQEYGYEYRATGSSVCWFACTTHSFACSALLALLTHSAACTHSFARFLTHSLPGTWLIKCLKTT